MNSGLNKVAPNTQTRTIPGRTTGSASTQKLLIIGALLFGGYMLFNQGKKSS